MPKKENLKPTQKQLVANIVDGLHLEMTSQYDWCFGDANDVGVVFVWYKSLREADGVIYFTDRTSDWIDENRDAALSVQKNRAQAVGDMILKAYWNGRPIRVAIVEGTTKKVGNRETSEAQFRELDDLQWYPHHRDPVTQQIVVTRGVPQPPGFNAYEEDHSIHSKGIVTGDAEERPVIPTSKATVYERDSQVVRDVKRRAADGRCEYCGEEGFPTPQGGFYLEAHHVIPLHCNGVDKVWNVVALCAEDHRRAHFGVNRDRMRDEMIIDVLSEHYPDRFEQLDEASLRMTKRDDASAILERDLLT